MKNENLKKDIIRGCFAAPDNETFRVRAKQIILEISNFWTIPTWIDGNN